MSTRVMCPDHRKVALVGSYCSACADKEMKPFKEAGMNVTASFGVKRFGIIRGKKRPMHHPTDYLEWEIPSHLMKRAEETLSSWIKEFLKNCDCIHCEEYSRE